MDSEQRRTKQWDPLPLMQLGCTQPKAKPGRYACYSLQTLAGEWICKSATIPSSGQLRTPQPNTPQMHEDRMISLTGCQHRCHQPPPSYLLLAALPVPLAPKPLHLWLWTSLVQPLWKRRIKVLTPATAAYGKGPPGCWWNQALLIISCITKKSSSTWWKYCSIRLHLFPSRL